MFPQFMIELEHVLDISDHFHSKKKYLEKLMKNWVYFNILNYIT